MSAGGKRCEVDAYLIIYVFLLVMRENKYTRVYTLLHNTPLHLWKRRKHKQFRRQYLHYESALNQMLIWRVVDYEMWSRAGDVGQIKTVVPSVCSGTFWVSAEQSRRVFWKGDSWERIISYSAHKMNLSLPFTYLLLCLFCFVAFLQQLPVITSNTIVRCRSCRTYINPFVTFLDQRRWKCNLCYRVNDGESSPELFFVRKFVQSRCFMAPLFSVLSRFLLFLYCSVPEEFMYNPVTRSYGEPHKRPEVQNPTVEFIASSDYMVSHHCVSTRGQCGHSTATSTDRKKERVL